MTSLGFATEPLGRIGSIELTADDLHDSMLSLNEAQRTSLRTDPVLLEQIARTSLVQKFVLHGAMQKKWHEQPQIVARLRRAHDSVITESFLESIASPDQDFPSETVLTSAYESARDSLKVPRSFRLAQIFISESQAQLTTVKDLLSAKDADFAKIASQHSQEPTSASRGGEMGWLLETQIDKELLPIVAELKLHEITKPVKLKDGWHILKLLDARAAYTPTLEQSRPQLVKQLRLDQLRLNSQAYLADLLRRHPLHINATALNEALLREPSANVRP